ncbi:hypothetical protein CCACVL1_04880 [Corchorus capsularis]|uniref:Uncharacterized protein n=1 Tax=Corchorus capsularis TaxID=210143 RepID=A0A1R3JNZ7_COCAP|nr:hypothetical protein CCACVL1_04880 [Corchorus capsularis]
MVVKAGNVATWERNVRRQG